MPGRREFLKTLVGGVAASAAVRTWPFRVYSFPRRLELDDHFAQYAVMQMWGKVIGSDRAVLLAQTRMVDGKPVDFSIPAGATILRFEAKILNGPTLYVPSITVRQEIAP